MYNIGLLANDQQVIVQVELRSIPRVYKLVFRALSHYQREVDNKSDEKLIEYIVINYVKPADHGYRYYGPIHVKLDLYKDINLKEHWAMYKGIRIVKCKNGYLFKIGKTVCVEERYDDCFRIIRKELRQREEQEKLKQDGQESNG